MKVQINLSKEQLSTIVTAGSKIGYSKDLSLIEFEKSIEDKVNAEILSLEEIIHDWSMK